MLHVPKGMAFKTFPRGNPPDRISSRFSSVSLQNVCGKRSHQLAVVGFLCIVHK